MRKRKSPIALVSVLVVVVATVVGYQFVTSQTHTPDAPPPPPESTDAPKSIGEPRAAESKATIAADIKSSLDAKPAGGPTAAPPMRPGMPPSGPMILKPQMAMPGGKPEKPKPNSSSTSAQWYVSESGVGKDKP